MTWWIVDLRDRVGQRVIPEADDVSPEVGRFFKVEAPDIAEAVYASVRKALASQQLDYLNRFERNYARFARIADVAALAWIPTPPQRPNRDRLAAR